jgi:glycosyltransferase involved in cell wall biosynthesis
MMSVGAGMAEQNNSRMVSVLMPVYNCEKYVAQAIESILHQTFESFEFIIINDASTDHTQEIIASFQDPRIRVYQNSTNLGLTRSLNIGIDLCKGKYIARMDGDDISHPDRLARQVTFLEDHPHTGLVGTDYERIASDGTRSGKIITHRTDWQLVHWMLYFENPIAHPTVCLRSDLIREVKGYDENFRYTQDYDLWDRLSGITHLANLPELLLFRRFGDESQTSTINLRPQLEYALKIRQRIVERLTGQIYPFKVIQLWDSPDFDLDPKIKYQAGVAILKIFFCFNKKTAGLEKDNVLSIRKDTSKRLMGIAKSMPDCGYKRLLFLFNDIFIRLVKIRALWELP